MESHGRRQVRSLGNNNDNENEEEERMQEEDEDAQDTNPGGDAPNSLVEVERDARHRKKLRPYKSTFYNKSEVHQVMFNAIHSYFQGPWRTFTQVPPHVKKQWWDELQDHYFWDDRDGPLIRRIWRSKCSSHIRNTFKDCRDNGKKPKFVSAENWAQMLIDWEADEKFQHQCEVNKRNRASVGEDGISNYAGGSKSTAEYDLEFKEKHGRDITMEELMTTVYLNKNTGTCSTRAEKCMERFKHLRQVWLESNPNLSKEDELMLWSEAVGGEKKGHLFGQGSLYCKDAYVLNPPALGPTPAARVLTPTARVPTPAAPAPTLTIAPAPFLMTPAAHVLTPTDYAPTPTTTPAPTPFLLPPAGLNQPFLQPQVQSSNSLQEAMTMMEAYQKQLKAYEESLRRREMQINAQSSQPPGMPTDLFQSLLNSTSAQDFLGFTYGSSQGDDARRQG